MTTIPHQADIDAAYAALDRFNRDLAPLGLRVTREVHVVADAPRVQMELDRLRRLRAMGPNGNGAYTGSVCQRCGSNKMVSRGGCEHCTDCGMAAGGCG